MAAKFIKALLICIWMLIIPAFASDAGEFVMLDDCADYSVVTGYSEEIYPSVIDEESRTAYDDDFSVFMRKTLTPAWIDYEIQDGKYPIFKAYFRQNEELAHFSFKVSEDGEVWQDVNAKIKVEAVESYKWIPVTYNLKDIDDKFKYIRIIFSDKNTVEWSPMLSRVSMGYKKQNEHGFVDCLDTPYDEATKKLKTLGFVSGANNFEYKPYETLSRAELAVFCSRLLGVDEINGETVFEDVNADSFAFNAVSALYNLNIINGDENGLFNPDSDVTYTEAIKMLVCTLGYIEEAEAKGGYPEGYLLVAGRIGLTDGVKGVDYISAVSRGDTALMMSNALDAELMYQVGFGETQKFDNGGILENYHNIKKVRGQITSADGMTVISDVNSGENIVVIDDATYYMNNFDVSGLLGADVCLYTDADTKEIIYAENKNSDITKITASEHPYIRDGKLFYESNNKETSYNLDGNTRIIYNGRYKTRAAMLDEFELGSGFINLIKTAGETDVLVIWEYKEYICAADSYLSGAVENRIGEPLKINSSVIQKADIVLYGEESEFDSAYVRRGDVLYVAQSEDGEVLYIEVIADKISGKVKETNNNCIVVDSKEYTLRKDAISIGEEYRAGSEIYAYTDINNRIFAVEISGAYEYAYLIKAADKGVLTEESRIRFLTHTNEIKEYVASYKTRLDGYTNKVQSIIALEPQLVRIKLNSGGYLSDIDTAINVNTVDAGEFACNFKSDACKYYGGSMCLFASVYRLSPQTPVFYVQDDINEVNEFYAGNLNGLYSDFKYNVMIFDTSDEYEVKAVVINKEKSDSRNVDAYDNVAIIRESEVFNNTKGDPCLKLSVYIRGEEREIYFDNYGGIDHTGSWLSGYTERNTGSGNNPFKTGEVIQYYSDQESHCKSFRMLLTDEIIQKDDLYEKNAGDYGVLNSENYFSELYSAYGVVEKRTSDKLIIYANEDGVPLRTIPLNSASVYCFERDKIIKTDVSDIEVGDKVFVRMAYADTTDILIVR